MYLTLVYLPALMGEKTLSVEEMSLREIMMFSLTQMLLRIRGVFPDLGSWAVESRECVNAPHLNLHTDVLPSPTNYYMLGI